MNLQQELLADSRDVASQIRPSVKPSIRCNMDKHTMGSDADTWK
jgi:hypothetical protein